MHLDLEIPNVWYEAHLTAGDFDVAGVTLPGVPYVIVGHNRRIAWGFTNLGPNVEDLYIEKFNDQGEYLTPQGWVKPEHRKEIIRVKGKPEVTLDVVTTRHGPIITDLIPGEIAQARARSGPSTIRRPRHIPFFAMDSAKNWQEFEAAFSQFGAPGQNVVYADVDGHIGYQATGLIPIRAAGDGSVPVPGDDDAHEWTGYVPYDKLPSVYDPPSGIIATANGRVTPDGYPYPLSIEWMSPYRTQRLYKLLNAPQEVHSADMLAIQTDIVSPFDRFCAERFVYAVDHTAQASQRAKSAADLMRNWDGTMDTDSRRRDHRCLLARQAGGTAAQAEAGRRLEGLPVVHEPGVAGERADPPAAALAAARLFQLRRAAGRRRRRGGERCQRNSLAGACGSGDECIAWTSQHPFWSHFPILKKGAGTGSLPLSGDERDHQAGGAALWAVRAPDGRLLRSGWDDAQHREWRVRQHLRRALQRSVGRLLSRTDVRAAVLAGGGTARGSASSAAGATKQVISG